MQLTDPSLLKQQAYINGAWTDANDQSVFDVTNPATGQLIAQVPDMDEKDTRLAIEQAEASQRPVQSMAVEINIWYEWREHSAELL